MHHGMEVWDNDGPQVTMWAECDRRIMKLAGIQELTDFKNKTKSEDLGKHME